MITKKLIEKLISEADIDNLKTFAQVAVEHLLNTEKYDDSKINNAIEIIMGVAKPYSICNISYDKVIEYIRSYGHRDRNITEAKIVMVDNFVLEVNVEYKVNENDSYNTSLTVPIRDVCVDEE